MAKEHYRDAVPCRLSEFVPPDRFRTVLYEQLTIPCGLTEIPVSVMLKKEAAGKLSFKVPRDGMLYGFARIRPFVKERFGAENAMMYINDWDDKFVVVFDLGSNNEKAFFVTSEEVVDLLENCIRVPQQRAAARKFKFGKDKN